MCHEPCRRSSARLTNNNGEVSSPNDVIRCVYLARLMERAGNIDAAQRWQAKVSCWLRRHAGVTRPDCPAARSIRAALKPAEHIQRDEFTGLQYPTSSTASEKANINHRPQGNRREL